MSCKFKSSMSATQCWWSGFKRHSEGHELTLHLLWCHHILAHSSFRICFCQECIWCCNKCCLASFSEQCCVCGILVLRCDTTYPCQWVSESVIVLDFGDGRCDSLQACFFIKCWLSDKLMMSNHWILYNTPYVLKVLSVSMQLCEHCWQCNR